VKTNLTATVRAVSLFPSAFIICTLLIVGFCQRAVAQNPGKPTDGGTPLSLQAGSPAGTYSLSGFDTINLYNGALNFSLPLLSIGGRGAARHTMMLHLQRHWMVEKYTDSEANIWEYPVDGREEQILPGYGPGTMAIRRRGVGVIPCEWHNPEIQYEFDDRYLITKTTLSFTLPDGTEMVFRDVAHNGQAGGAQLCGNHDPDTIGYNRGKVWTTIDGSQITFVSAADIRDAVIAPMSTPETYDISGYLYFPDGTVYEIGGGLVGGIRDRNGNRISFSYGDGGVTLITDSLNRHVTVQYNVNEGGQYGVCDKITYIGFAATPRVIRISKASLSTVLRSGYSLTTYPYLFGLDAGSAYYNPTVVSAVWLPDSDSVNRRYQIQYNNYGEVARVIVPTGAAFEYDWSGGMSDGSATGLYGSYGLYGIYRRVVERRAYDTGGTGTSYTSRATYSRPESQGGTVNQGYVTVEQRDINNTLLDSSKHYLHGSGATTGISVLDGKEDQIDRFDTNGTTVLRRVIQTWDASTSAGPHILETRTTIEPNGANLVSKQTFSYDQYNNQTDVYEYGFGSGSAGSLVRRTHTGYLTTQNGYDYACDPSTTCSVSANPSNIIHLRNLPTQSSVFDLGGTERARTNFEYDNYAVDTNHAGLLNRSDISGLSSTTSYVTRGNPTATTLCLAIDVSGSCTSSISGYAQFDIAGNVVKAIDGRSNAILFYFDDRFGAPDGNAETNTAPSELSSPVVKHSFAFATYIKNAKNHEIYVQFDYYTGKPVDAKDANGIVSSGYYDDPLDRPKQIRRAVGVSGVESQTTFAYDDANRVVTTTGDKVSNNDNVLVSKELYDQRGRTTESRQYEGGTNYIVNKRDYDALGRAYRMTNPYRPWNSESAAWTTNVYDALGRTVSTTSPDGSVVTTSYSGNTITATDPAGKTRRSVNDALGRLIRVDEPNSSGNLDSGGSPVQSTDYTYNVLDDLTQVSQGSQTRTFAYDMLKRMTSATNPESGTVTVNAYDNNGNVLVSTDARGVSTHVSYDELNRPTRRWYNGSTSISQTTNNTPSLPSGVATTDEVKFYYDSETLPSGAPSFTRGYSTGALVAITYGGGSAGTYRGYDAAGRGVRQYQQTDSVNYLVEASYNVNSSVASKTYPAVPGANDRRTVSWSYDSAGRMSSLSSSATTYAGAASLSSIQYSSSNALKSETYGNSLIHAVSYNNRLQPTEIKLGTSSNPTSALDLIYSYGTTTNNGNIQSVSYSGGGLSYTQSYTYDTSNRLATATETVGGNTSWSQTNAYDRYGNRRIHFFGNSYNLDISSTNNRITTYSYDSSGNVTSDGVHSYGFDGDGKIKSVDGTTAYTYDGEGKRVRKLIGENTRFIYGIGGELVAEYWADGTLMKEYLYGASMITIEPKEAKESLEVQYATADHLGSPRVITNASGSVMSRHDYMPFGEELGAGTSGRTTGMGFSAGGDTNRKQFTGYERDTETGLDFAQARFYGSIQGRFTSPDPFSASAVIADPQTFNRYAYCRNNPVNSTDPTGMLDHSVAAAQSQRRSVINGMHAEGMSIIAEDEARYEDYMATAQLALLQGTSVTVIISEDTSQEGGTQSQAKPVATFEISVPITGDLKVTAVRVVVEQMSEPGSFDRKVINGTKRTGVGVHLVYYFYDQNNNPLKATVLEHVARLEGNKVTQNEQEVPLTNGKGGDWVTNSAPTPRNKAEGDALFNQLKSAFTTKQDLSLTISLESGPKVEVTQVRILTNQTPAGLRPEDKVIGPGFPGYAFSMEPLKGRQIKP
jgi:RHS repeat-associated protein